MRAEWREQMEADWAPVRSQLEEAQRENRTLKLDNVVKTTMGASGVRPERVDALFRLVGDRFDLTDDGTPVLRDFRGKDVAKYIAEEVAKEFPEFYKGTGSSGGSASKSATSGGGRVREIARDDSAAFMANLEGIAKGEIAVVD